MALRIKINNKPAEVIPTGHDTKPSDDKKMLVVVDADGKDVEGKIYDPATVEVVERF